MGGFHFRGWLAVVLTAAMVAVAAAQSSGGGIPTCATKLAPCANYLNATTAPPASCCNPLKEAVMKERACLCDIYRNPAILQALQINVTQIMGLPMLCSIDIGKDPTALCKGTAQSPSSSSAGSAQSSPGGTTSGSGSGSGSASGSGGSNSAATVDKFARTGLLASLLVFSAYVMFY